MSDPATLARILQRLQQRQSELQTLDAQLLTVYAHTRLVRTIRQNAVVVNAAGLQAVKDSVRQLQREVMPALQVSELQLLLPALARAYVLSGAKPLPMDVLVDDKFCAIADELLDSWDFQQADKKRLVMEEQRTLEILAYSDLRDASLVSLADHLSRLVTGIIGLLMRQKETRAKLTTLFKSSAKPSTVDEGRLSAKPLSARELGTILATFNTPAEVQALRRKLQKNKIVLEPAAERYLAMADYLSLQKLHRELADNNDKIAHDFLTRLPNERTFLERGREAVARAKKSTYRFCVIACDLDNFKAINDTIGHEGGDLAIAMEAKVLLDSLRQGDSPARLHGDEFAALVKGGEAEGIAAAERIRANAEKYFVELISKIDPQQKIGKDVITISLGVAEWKDEYKTIEELIKAADNALLCAKSEGKNRVSNNTRYEASGVVGVR